MVRRAIRIGHSIGVRVPEYRMRAIAYDSHVRKWTNDCGLTTSTKPEAST